MAGSNQGGQRKPRWQEEEEKREQLVEAAAFLLGKTPGPRVSDPLPPTPPAGANDTPAPTIRRPKKAAPTVEPVPEVTPPPADPVAPVQPVPLPEIERIPEPEPKEILKVRRGTGEVKLTEATLADLKQDPENLRRHTPRGIGTIVNALHEVGTGRSVVIDEKGKLLAGNGTHEAAAEAGIEKVVILDVPGDVLVAVRRTDLNEDEKTRLAIFDNRASDLSAFDPEALSKLNVVAPKMLDTVFTPAELETIDIAAEIEKIAAETEAKNDAPLVFPEGGLTGPPKPKKPARLFHYRLDFDNAEQKRKWDLFRRWVAQNYGGDDSEAACLLAFLEEHAPDYLEDRLDTEDPDPFKPQKD